MDPNFKLYEPWPSNDKEAKSLFEKMERALSTRRSLREFSDAPVMRQTIERLIALAASAPSGANKQPWHFVAVQDPEVKRQIRLAAEEEEKAFYGGRASDEWLSSMLIVPSKGMMRRNVFSWGDTGKDSKMRKE